MSFYRHILGKQTERPLQSEGLGPAVSAHAVQFYENDSIFIESLGEFVGAALGAAGVCIVVATTEHHWQLIENLGSNSIDVVRAIAEGRYVRLDAKATLSQMMEQGRLDGQKFRAAIEPAVIQARRTLKNSSGIVSVFGEMVAILWAEGNHKAAIELEHLWSEVVQEYNLNLRCAYHVGSFDQYSYSEMFAEIASQHSTVLAREEKVFADKRADGDEQVISLRSGVQSESDAIVEEREKEIAHRRVVEEKLRRTEEFTRSIIESSADCVKVLDLEGRIQYMSPSGQRALELTEPGQFLNKSWVDLWKIEDKARAEEAISAARKGGEGCFQGEGLTASGVKKSWDVRITPALDRQGKIERLVAVSRDVTELKTAQQLAIQSEKLAATGRLAATIAHEINNPLEAVTNFIYLAMTAKGLPEEVCRHLEIADRELARVSQIAQQTLGFYRGSSNDRWIVVADLIRDILIVYERKLGYKQIETVVSVPPELKLFGRQGELRQALSNLLTNAIDASRKGGKVWLHARPSRNWGGAREEGVRITLADNGSGMSREVQRKIFVPFFTTKAEIGTGIGLWATKTLIEQNGGFLRFRSRQGESPGTVMSIFLPNGTPQVQGEPGSN